jgi:uncharacterized protein YjbI with pentapeptide repeats
MLAVAASITVAQQFGWARLGRAVDAASQSTARYIWPPVKATWPFLIVVAVSLLLGARRPADLHAMIKGRWPRSRRWLTVLVAVVGVGGLFAIALVLAPPWFVHDGSLEGLKAQNQVRTTLLQGLGGVVLLVGAYVGYRQLQLSRRQLDQTATATREQLRLGWQQLENALAATQRQHELDRQGQITQRFTHAIDQLGHAQLDVRLGGIYALERIARDSLDDRATIGEVLTAFVRGAAPWPPIRPRQYVARAPIGEVLELQVRAPDVQASVTVLGRGHFASPTAQGGQLDLHAVDLRRADLTGAHLENANLAAAHLDGATLRDTYLERANLHGAGLERADLEGAGLERATLHGAQLAEASLHGTHLKQANLTCASLEGASLINADLEEADLHSARLEGANLTQAKLDRANLFDANLRDARLIEAQLVQAQLKFAQLEGAFLHKAILEKADLTGARLEGAHLSGAHLERAHLSGAHLDGAFLRQTNLDDAYLGEASLERAILSGASLNRANFVGARLGRARLTTAQLNGAILTAARLQGADLRRAQLEGAQLRGAQLEEAILDFANLQGAVADERTRWPDGFDWRAAGVILEGEAGPTRST